MGYYNKFSPILITGSQPVELTYQATFGNEVNTSSYSFLAQPIGAADDRDLVLVVIQQDRNGASSVSSVTIGGVTATMRVETNSSLGQQYLGIWSAVVPTGTTADVSVVFTGIGNRAGGAIYTAKNVTDIAGGNTYVTTASPAVFTSVDIPANGVVLCASSTQSNTTNTWTNATEESDGLYTSGATTLTTAQANTDNTITATPASGGVGGRYCGVAVAFN